MTSKNNVLALEFDKYGILVKKDFYDKILLVKEVNFINSFSFIYNPRPGTPASNLEEVNRETQMKRLTELQNLLAGIQIESNKNEIGKLTEVLIENKMKNQTKYFGRNENLTPVVINNASEKDVGKIISVRIKDCNRNTLFGVKENMEREAAA